MDAQPYEIQKFIFPSLIGIPIWKRQYSAPQAFVARTLQLKKLTLVLDGAGGACYGVQLGPSQDRESWSGRTPLEHPTTSSRFDKTRQSHPTHTYRSKETCHDFSENTVSTLPSARQSTYPPIGPDKTQIKLGILVGREFGIIATDPDKVLDSEQRVVPVRDPPPEPFDAMR